MNILKGMEYLNYIILELWNDVINRHINAQNVYLTKYRYTLISNSHGIFTKIDHHI